MGNNDPAWGEKSMSTASITQEDARFVDIESGGKTANFVELCHALEQQIGPSRRARGTSQLFQTIKGEILPRLMLLHSAEGELGPELSSNSITDEEVDEFVQIVLNEGTTFSGGYVAQIMARGVRAESIFTDLLSPVARKLGELWEEDICTFSDVTVALCRLHQILREYSVENTPYRPMPNTESSGRVLLSNAEGEQHVFGLLLVAEFLRRDHWRVWCEPGLDNQALGDLVAAKPFDVVGLSATHTESVDRLPRQINNLRARSCNPNLKIIVGGGALVAQPLRVAEVGADGYAPDAETASAICSQLLEETNLSY